MELLSSNVKKVSGNENPEKNSYIFSKKSFSYISGNGNSEKNFYILGSGTFLFFSYISGSNFRSPKNQKNPL